MVLELAHLTRTLINLKNKYIKVVFRLKILLQNTSLNINKIFNTKTEEGERGFWAKKKLDPTNGVKSNSLFRILYNKEIDDDMET